MFRVGVSLPAGSGDAEYYIEVANSDGPLRFPATAPLLNQTVVVCPTESNHDFRKDHDFREDQVK